MKEKYNERSAGGFFKYYELEQFEDILQKAVYEDKDIDLRLDAFASDMKLLYIVHIDDYADDFKVNLQELHENIDILESYANRIGIYKTLSEIEEDKSRVREMVKW